MNKKYVKPVAEIIEFNPKESILDNWGAGEEPGFGEASVPDEW